MPCSRRLPKLDYLSKSDPQIILYTRGPDSVPWVEQGRTETIWDCHDPSFVTPFVLNYRFSVEQHLRFLILDIDNAQSRQIKDHDIVGSVEMTLGSIVTARSRIVEHKIKPESSKISDAGVFIVQAEELADSKKSVKLRFSGFGLKYSKILFFGSCSPFFRILRSAESGTFATVYESPTVNNQSSKVVWPSFELSMNTLCNGDSNRELVIQVMNRKSNGDHESIGSANTSILELTRLAGLSNSQGESISSNASWGSQFSQNELQLRRGGKTTGAIIVQQCSVESVDSFLDFIQGGMQIALSVAIDFTASNGDPQSPDSLHFRSPVGALNEYQRAIVAVGSILEPYDTDKKFPVYGFGGHIQQKTNHCFPLNFNDSNPEVEGVRGILDVYSHSLNMVQLSGPTYFRPIIEQTAYNVKQTMQKSHGQVHYHVLLILTDGEINDMKETVRSIIQATDLPLSIVIVGVGSADFTRMETLDADEALGVQMRRDIVQFVPFRRFQGIHNHHRLAEEVLAEIPDQVLSYMKVNHIKPAPAPPAYF